MNVLDSFRLDGLIAMVTGMGRSIGQAIAIALADQLAWFEPDGQALGFVSLFERGSRLPINR